MKPIAKAAGRAIVITAAMTGYSYSLVRWPAPTIIGTVLVHRFLEELYDECNKPGQDGGKSSGFLRQ